MRGKTHIISEENRAALVQMVERAPVGMALNISQPSRSAEQNAKMWAMLSDIVQTRIEGRMWTVEVWKCAFMQALGHEVQFAEGLDGSGPFPIGYRSSHMTKSQMADLITIIIQYGDQHGVQWTDPRMIAQEAALLEINR
jgi:hypothetical protein